METMVTEVRQGLEGQAQEMQDVMARFADSADIRTQATRTAYKAALRRLWDYMQDNHLQEVSRADIVQFREVLSQSLAPASVNLYLVGIRRFFEYLVDLGMRATNPAAKVKALKLTTEHKRDYFEPEQVRAIMATTEGDSLGKLRDAAIISVMVTTGMRCIEVARADDADLRAVHGELRLYIQGKGHTEKDDYVRISGKAAEALQAYRQARGASLPLFSNLPSNAKQGGERLTTRSISRIAKGHFRAAGIDDPTHTAHSLRHTAATLNLKAGASLEETRQLLRHTNINTTLIYQHAITRENNRSEARIEQAIFG